MTGRLTGRARVSHVTSAVRNCARAFSGSEADYGCLLTLVGDARFTLLGEASHGTHEFYRERAEITKRLILEKGCTAVAVEADWPDAYRVNRYVRGISDDADANAALSGFKRFPAWMWRNHVVLEFVQWLREHNDRQPPSRKAGFYGIDLYSLFTSPSRRCSPIWKRSIRKRRSARAIAIRASITSARTHRHMVMPRPSAWINHAKMKW